MHVYNQKLARSWFKILSGYRSKTWASYSTFTEKKPRPRNSFSLQRWVRCPLMLQLINELSSYFTDNRPCLTGLTLFASASHTFCYYCLALVPSKSLLLPLACVPLHCHAAVRRAVWTEAAAAADVSKVSFPLTGLISFLFFLWLKTRRNKRLEVSFLYGQVENEWEDERCRERERE